MKGINELELYLREKPLLMNKNYMNSHNEDFILKITPRPSEIVSIKIPLDTLANLEIIAQNRNLSVESLIIAFIKKMRYNLGRKFLTMSTLM